MPDEHGDRDLQAGGAVVGHELARLLDGQLRAVPVGILLVPGEQHAELVDAREMSSIRMRVRSCSCQLRPANSCTDTTAESLG